MWTAYVTGEDPRLEVSARLLKLLVVLNGNNLPEMGKVQGLENVYVMNNYQLGFAQDFNVGSFNVEIVLED